MQPNFSSLPPLEECTIDFSPVPPPTWRERLIQVVSFPFRILRMFYHTYLLIRHREIRAPLLKSKCPMHWIGSFSSFVYSTHVTAHPAMMKAILKHSRKDPEKGIFDDRITAQLFLPFLKDLYPEEKIETDDFFLSCYKNVLTSYRRPVLQFIGAQNIRNHAVELEKIVKETVHFWAEEAHEKKASAPELSSVFTTSVISRLLLGHPGPFDVYLEIARAVSCINQSAVQRVIWKQNLSPEGKKKYEKSLTVMRQAIETALTTQEKPALGSLVDALRQESQMSELRIKTTLFMMYLGGSETTSLLLSYILWQLGRHPSYQEEIYQEIDQKQDSLFDIAAQSTTLDKLFAESIRLMTPVYVMGRYPAKELFCSIKDKEGKIIFQKKVSPKEGLTLTPTFAGRDPLLYKDPDTFNPHRFETIPKTLPWLPFGDGHHSCPGQWLVKAEITVLIAEIVRRFKIQSFPETEIQFKGHMTLQPDETWIQLTPR